MFRDGSLVKAPKKSLVYLVSNGRKRGFRSAEAFLKQGYDFRNIITSNEETFSDLPSAEDIDSDEQEKRHPAGTLVNISGTIYLMTETGRKGISSADVFDSYGFRFEGVVPANSEDLLLPIEGMVTPRLTFVDNHSPTKPVMTSGVIGTPAGVEGWYDFISTDPDGDTLTYILNWGDGTGEEKNWPCRPGP